MDDSILDEFNDSLTLEDLTNDNFDSNSQSLSPCILSATSINPTEFPDSPKGLGPNSDDFVEPPKKAKNLPRTVYLVTYSQADVLKVQSREKFAEFVCTQFNRED